MLNFLTFHPESMQNQNVSPGNKIYFIIVYTYVYQKAGELTYYIHYPIKQIDKAKIFETAFYDLHRIKSQYVHHSINKYGNILYELIAKRSHEKSALDLIGFVKICGRET